MSEAARHKSHMGITKTLTHAHTGVFWPDMGKDITNFLSTCSSFAKYQDKQQKEPYQTLDTNTTPWSLFYFILRPIL